MMMGGPSCESCGRPMMSAQDRGGGKADNRYCRACCDSSGALKPYDAVLKTLVEQEFMGRNGMKRDQAEVAARNALSRNPAWRGHT